MDQKSPKSQRVVLVPGATSGFGRACARYLCQKGFHVYGTSRKADYGQPPIEIQPGGAYYKIIPMDVRETSSVTAGIAHILENEGGIDIRYCCQQRLSPLYKRWAPSLMYERSFMKYYKLL